MKLISRYLPNGALQDVTVSGSHHVHDESVDRPAGCMPRRRRFLKRTYFRNIMEMQKSLDNKTMTAHAY
jgi:hypothetical protein